MVRFGKGGLIGGHTWVSGDSQSLSVFPHWPGGSGFPHSVQICSLTPSLNISSSEDHKPIWMHAEEREKMSRVSRGPSTSGLILVLVYYSPLALALNVQYLSQPGLYLSPVPTCSPTSLYFPPQSRHRESGTPYAEYGGWYKACKVSR